jgi:hypothetical protein
MGGPGLDGAVARAAARISRLQTFARGLSNLERRRPRDGARGAPLGAIAPIPGESLEEAREDQRGAERPNAGGDFHGHPISRAHARGRSRAKIQEDDLISGAQAKRARQCFKICVLSPGGRRLRSPMLPPFG